MILKRTEILIDRGNFSKSEDWRGIRSEIIQSIRSLEHPPGAGRFILRNESGKKRGKGRVELNQLETCSVAN